MIVITTDIPNKFAEVFASACTPNSIGDFNNDQAAYKLNKTHLPISDSNCYVSCSLQPVKDIIKKLKRNKAPSLDGLTVKQYIELPPYCCYYNYQTY